MTTMSSKLDQPEILAYIFHPGQQPNNGGPENSVDLDIPTADGSTIGCRFHPAAKDATNIICFHGNGETVSDYDDIAAEYNKQGLNLFMVTYRGYGWSTGSPTVTAMFEDALVIFNRAKDWLIENGYTEPVFVMGRSIGSASALEIGLEEADAVKGLIIESGFSESISLLQNIGLDTDRFELQEEDCFNNLEKISEIKLPTLFLHGARDEIIPVQMAEKLQAESGARNKKFMVIPGAGHNTMMLVGGTIYFETIKTFTDGVCGKTQWRYRRRKSYRRENK